MKNNQVAAIIVTYNRYEDVLKCLESVKKQTQKVSKIFLIDNCSDDKRYNKLKEDQSIKYIRTDRNSGGAGGFKKGLKIAFDEGYEYFWLMDDDGIASFDELENLFFYKEDFDMISPLVISIEDNKELSFGVKGEFDRQKIENQYERIIEERANPFNGILLKRKVIERIGLPKEEMFIWGDENEYQQRILKNKFKICTVIKAKHFHPKNRILPKSILKNKIKIIYPEGKLRLYCYFRNYAYIYRQYFSFKVVFNWILKNIFYILFYRRSLSEFYFFYKAVKDGLEDNFNNHYNYLNRG